MDDDDENDIKKRNTINKLETTLKKKKEEYEMEKEKVKKRSNTKVLAFNEKEKYKKSIVNSKPAFNKENFEKKVSIIINNYIEKHEMKQFEKIPYYLEKKEDDSLLIKQCDQFNKYSSDDYLPLIIISDKFYEQILSFLDEYMKYNEYNFILTLKNKLLIPISKIKNYNIFHKEKLDEGEYNSFISETISSSIINIYNKDEIKEIKNNIGIASKEFKEDFQKSIKQWVTTIYDILSDYILFKLKEKPLYYCCEKCRMPIMYKENNIDEDIIENINEKKDVIDNDKNNKTENENTINENKIENEIKLNNDINNNIVLNKEKIIKKRNEKKKEKEKIFMDKVKNNENEGIKYTSLFNIANTIVQLINFNFLENNGKKEKGDKITANPPGKSEQIENEKKEVNIIYYDENKHTNFDLIERVISGTFVFINDHQTMDNVINYLNSIAKIKNFILIVNGKNCEKIFEDLNNENYLNSFASCCLITTNKKYDYLSSKYNKEIKIFKTKKDIIQFIKNHDNIEIVKSTRLVSYKKYSDSYYKFHEKISSFYGNLTFDLYEFAVSLFEDFLKTPGNTDPKELLESFELFKEIEQNKEKIVQLYTNENEYYPVFNKWLYQLDSMAYEKTSYFLSGIMYSLNLFGNEQKNQTCEMKLYRGMRLDIINLLPYKNCEGKIIVFPSFTSTTYDLGIAEGFSKRNKPIEYRKEKKIFAVIFYIGFNLKSNWFPNGIDVHSISCYGYEKEILFQPFTFFKITKTDIDFTKNIADIYLEVIGKKEILEEKIKTGKRITYNLEQGIMEVVD